MSRLLALALAMTALAAPMGQAAIEMTPAAPTAPVKMYSAIDGMSVERVAQAVRKLPVTTTDPAHPRCDYTAAIGTAMKSEFAEAPVGRVGAGLRVFASDQQGTFTVVMDRANGSSCVIASGTGYKTGKKDQIFRILSPLSDRIALR